MFRLGSVWLFIGLFGPLLWAGWVGAEALPLLRGGDPFARLQQLELAANAATSAEARDLLKLQAALLARILGEQVFVERLLKMPTASELVLLKFFVDNSGAPPPALPHWNRYDALSRRVLEQWLGQALSCWNNTVDPMLCPGMR